MTRHASVLPTIRRQRGAASDLAVLRRICFLTALSAALALFSSGCGGGSGPAGGQSAPPRLSKSQSPDLSVPQIRALFNERFSIVTQVTFGGLAYPPLPATNIDDYTIAHGVSGVYSPSVQRSRTLGSLILAAGVSMHCQTGTVARDSIILAQSFTGGQEFGAVSYAIEPNPTTCLVPKEAWHSGTTVQVNDPSLLTRNINGQEYTYMLYTASIWNTLKTDPNGTRICGSIGLAVFDKNLRLISRNDHFLDPDRSACYERFVPVGDRIIDAGPEGYSRPEFMKMADGTYELVFDNAGNVMSLPITSLGSLPRGNIRAWGIGPYTDVFPLRIGRHRVLVAGAISASQTGLMYSISSLNVANWTVPSFTVSTPSTVCPSGWDCDGHASPSFFIDPDSCAGRMYVAGGKLADDPNERLYDHISLGFLEQPSNALGVALCDWMTDEG